jgi:hypothetical protein
VKRLLLVIFLLLPGATGATDVFPIQEVADVVLNGSYEQDNIGLHLDAGGDINGDGLMDFLLGTDHSVRVDGDPNVQWGYIIMGATDLPPVIELGDPPPGSVTIRGGGFTSARLTVAGLGDFNGDGYDDAIFGDLGASPGGLVRAGQAFILYGTAELPAYFELADPQLPGVMVSGYRTRGFLGYSVAGAGDVNADGFTDAIIGSPATDTSGTLVEAFIIFGGTDVPRELTANGLSEYGVRLVGREFGDTFGASVAGAGDLNRDGFADVAVGAFSETNITGEYAVIIYGARDLPSLIDIAALGNRGVLIYGPHIDDSFGLHVSGAGDVNDDGYDDMLIGAHRAWPNDLEDAGQAYLIFGGPGLPGEIHAATLDGFGLVINGTDRREELGSAVASAGDVNHDGICDFCVATFDSRMHIIFGDDDLRNHSVVSPIESFDRVTIVDWWNPLNPLGLGFANVGDVNDDGADDLLTGDFGVSPNGKFVAGSAYLIYGSDRFRSMRQKVDLNHDGLVDSKDLFIFSREWMKDLSGKSGVPEAGEQ